MCKHLKVYYVKVCEEYHYLATNWKTVIGFDRKRRAWLVFSLKCTGNKLCECIFLNYPLQGQINVLSTLVNAAHCQLLFSVRLSLLYDLY